MKYLRPFLFAAIALSAARAHAATSTATFSFPATTLYSGSAASVSGAPALISATFSQFNPALGTLTRISFSYYYHFTISYTGTSGGGGAVGGPLETNQSTTNIGPTINASFSASGSGSTTTSASSAAPYTPTAALSTYSGNGTYTFDWNAQLGFGSGGNEFLNSVKLDNTSYVTASYTYTPGAVPEPSTWALLGVGAAGLALASRRVPARRA